MKANIKEIAIFGMLGAIMYASMVALKFLPNIHLIGTFIVALTVVYRKKALYPIYVFIFLTGLFSGFGTWWIPYLYVWTVLWTVTMLLPRNMKPKTATAVYIAASTLHGLLFGTLYAPAQAVLFGLNFEGTIAWIISGLPWDALHGAGNLVMGTLIMPIISILKTAEKFARR